MELDFFLDLWIGGFMDCEVIHGITHLIFSYVLRG